jgi:predicted MPP superfamily phosphohydrolase
VSRPARMLMPSRHAAIHPPSHRHRIPRRVFLTRLLAAAGALGCGAATCSGYAYLVEPHWPAVTRLDVGIPALPHAMDGLTIAHLSDLHHGPDVPMADLRRAVALTNKLRPDLVALTGDFISDDSVYALPCADALAGLQSTYGSFACLGNHDHWHGAQPVIAALRGVGVHLLLNEAMPVDGNSSGLWIAGVDDIWEGLDDLERAMAGVPEDQPTLLLAHEPDFADTAAAWPSIALQLSGHSHGGQVRLPVYGALIVPSYAERYPIGYHRVREMALYTSRGIGLVAPPVRLNCRPEIALITLRAA